MTNNEREQNQPELFDAYYALVLEIRPTLYASFHFFMTLQPIVSGLPAVQAIIERYGSLSNFLQKVEDQPWTGTITLVQMYFWMSTGYAETNFKRLVEIETLIKEGEKKLDKLNEHIENLEGKLFERLDLKLKETQDRILTKIASLEKNLIDQISSSADRVDVKVDQINFNVSAEFTAKFNAIIEVINTVQIAIERKIDVFVARIEVAIQRSVTEIQVHFDQQLTIIVHLVNQLAADFTIEVEFQLNNLKTWITQTLNEKFEAVTNLISQFQLEITSTVETKFNQLRTYLDLHFGDIGTITTRIDTNVTSIVEITGSFRPLLIEVGVAMGILNENLLNFQTAAAVAFLEINGLALSIQGTVQNMLSLIKKFPDLLLSKIHDLMGTLISPLPETVSEHVACKIVGATYYRWDLDTNYSPTLVFIFEESKKGFPKRQTQIKAKLPFTTETLPPDIIEQLAATISAKGEIAYQRGPLRASFVHPVHRWKTTLFVSQKEEAIRILTYVFAILNIPPALEGVSYTEGRNKFSLSKLRTRIKGIEPRLDDPNEVFTVVLKRVVLLVNNAKSPTLVWKSQ